ncbi:metallo-beta-lactamase family protein [Prosthecobacter debontii]|uniref:Metallo-beta-lactamase family protein n=2 Tax=Prosthecobacter debontii TaxID=48467 RepID=A0A1T4Y9R2_9BACT|nr:metallo-beta-lactamase family protein [Prosthecobacter debontii]
MDNADVFFHQIGVPFRLARGQGLRWDRNTPTMKITFCGAAGTTTGSKHLIEINGVRILLDCGLYQGRRKEAMERNRDFPFDPAQIDCVVLSHAHIDHAGNLPHLCKRGFSGNIYATPPTRDLCSIMLPDAAHIHESDIQWLNKHRKREDLPLLLPSYTKLDAENCMKQFVTLSYNRPMIIADGVSLTFIDAGHILGSAQVILDLEERATGKRSRLLFSGDVGRPENDLLEAAAPSADVDYVIMESTYGGRKHELPAQTSEHICHLIRLIQQRRAHMIIPAFAVERTQQLLYTLDKLRAENCFSPVPTYVDSPLAVRATEIFRLHLEDLKATVRESVFMRNDPFGFEGLHLVRSVDESKSLNKIKGPAIIISASGMAESGRILHHLRNNVSNEDNIILFVGYCAENTLGWKLRNGNPKVNILGDEFAVNAQIETLDSFSGHADHDELLAYFDRIKGSKQRVFLVHGEPERSSVLCEALKERHPQGKVEVASMMQSVEL